MLSNQIIYAFPVFIAGTFIGLIGILIYKNRPELVRNRALSGMCFCVAIWFYSYSFNYMFPHHDKTNLFIFRLAYVSITLIWVTYLHFTLAFLGIKNRNLLKFSYYFALLLSLLTLFTNKVVGGIYYYFWGPYPKAGILHPIHLLYAGYIWWYCLLNLYKGYKNKEDKYSITEANRIRYVFWAYVIGNSAAIDYIQNYGYQFYPLGWLNVTVWVGVVAYAIIRHQLLDIEVIIKKTIVFAGLFAGVYAVISGFAFLSQVVFEQYIGANRWISLIPTILVIVAILRPLENFLVKVTDRFLFQKKYDYRELLKTFSTEVLTVLDLDKLVKITVEKLADIVKIESCGILLWNKHKEYYELRASVGLGLNWKDIYLMPDNTLVKYLTTTKSHLSVKQHTEGTKLPARLVEDMNKLKLELAIPLVIHDEMKGILTLGKKKSDENYTQDDMDILLPLARTIAIAISNATVLDDLQKTQAEAAQKEKMAVIGTLSAGINHEICNPLGIARGLSETYLLNLRDGIYQKLPPEELIQKSKVILEKVIKEVDRATHVTKRLSSFAKPSKGEYNEDVSFKEIGEEVVALLGYEMKMENIELQNMIADDFPHIKADRKQVQEIIFNLVRNAAQAIKDKGRITLSGRIDAKKVYIDIEDTGHGIPDEVMEQLFRPFMTTKEPGKGTGLGLFIVQQVIEKNGGKISVKSKVGVGTTFTLEFPKSLNVAAEDAEKNAKS